MFHEADIAAILHDHSKRCNSGNNTGVDECVFIGVDLHKVGGSQAHLVDNGSSAFVEFNGQSAHFGGIHAGQTFCSHQFAVAVVDGTSHETGDLRQVFNANDLKQALERKKDAVEKYQTDAPRLSKWIDENIRSWRLIKYIPNKYSHTDTVNLVAIADFYIYEKSK